VFECTCSNALVRTHLFRATGAGARGGDAAGESQPPQPYRRPCRSFYCSLSPWSHFHSAGPSRPSSRSATRPRPERAAPPSAQPRGGMALVLSRASARRNGRARGWAGLGHACSGLAGSRGSRSSASTGCAGGPTSTSSAGPSGAAAAPADAAADATAPPCGSAPGPYVLSARGPRSAQGPGAAAAARPSPPVPSVRRFRSPFLTIVDLYGRRRQERGRGGAGARGRTGRGRR